MKLRTFTAANMPLAMKMVRDELGDDAVILSTHTDKSQALVRVTAATERFQHKHHEEHAPSPRYFNREEIEPQQEAPEPSIPKRQLQLEWLLSLEETLRFHNTPAHLIRKLAQAAKDLDLDSMIALQKLAAVSARSVIEGKMLGRILDATFSFSPLPLHKGGLRLMLIGQPGIGKTVSIAKLATQLVMEGKSVHVITTDTKRAGGIEQLAAFTDILGLPLEVAKDANVLADLSHRPDKSDCILIDTAGCNPFQADELSELKNLIIMADAEPILTLPAGLDTEEAIDIARAFASSAITRLLVTRMDSARRFGSILAAADAAGLSFCHGTNTSKVVGEFVNLDAQTLAQYLLQHKGKN